jgi:hypothetical protein
MMPIYQDAFNLSYHELTEMAERLIVATERSDSRIVVPEAGRIFEPAAPPAVQRWWPDVP